MDWVLEDVTYCEWAVTQYTPREQHQPLAFNSGTINNTIRRLLSKMEWFKHGVSLSILKARMLKKQNCYWKAFTSMDKVSKLVTAYQDIVQSIFSTSHLMMKVWRNCPLCKTPLLPISISSPQLVTIFFNNRSFIKVIQIHILVFTTYNASLHHIFNVTRSSFTDIIIVWIPDLVRTMQLLLALLLHISCSTYLWSRQILCGIIQSRWKYP